MQATLTTFLLLASLAIQAQDAPDQIALFVPAFEGPGNLGQNTATVLNLRVWSSLRRKPWPNNPKDLDFGKGLIIWDPSPLRETSHAEAENRTKALYAQMALWGKAYPYGDGVVVQANMSIPKYHDFRDSSHEIWRVKVRDATVSADIPRRRFELSSVVLKRELIKQYSLPSALAIYENRQGGEAIGTVGDSYHGVQFERQRDLAKVATTDPLGKDLMGWVRLPQLSEQPTEVSRFVAGIIKIFRSDWEGALSEMERVIRNPDTRTSLKIDAHLYAGRALEQLGRSGREHFEQALGLNPLARRSVRYLAMSDLARLARAEANGAADTSLLSRLRKTVAEHERLFAGDDPWLMSVKAVLGER